MDWAYGLPLLAWIVGVGLVVALWALLLLGVVWLLAAACWNLEGRPAWSGLPHRAAPTLGDIRTIILPDVR